MRAYFRQNSADLPKKEEINHSFEVVIEKNVIIGHPLHKETTKEVKMITKTICTLVAAAVIGLSGCGKSDMEIKDTYHFEKQQEVVLTVPAPIYQGSAFTAADWNKDGDLDFLAADANGFIYVYLNNNSQYYKSEKPVMEVPTPMYQGAAFTATDWDKDGNLDILAADGNGHIHVYLNRDGGLVESFEQ